MDDSSAGAHHDAVLVARALGAEGGAAFGDLVRRHQGTLRARLERLTGGDRAWADDLAQEAFLKAWRKLDQFRGEALFSSWLYRIAYTMFLQAVRTRRPGPHQGVHEQDASEHHFRTIALRQDLDAALRELPEPDAAAIMLCYDFDMSHADAAYVLGIPLGTVKTRIARAKARLRERLQAWRGDLTA